MTDFTQPTIESPGDNLPSERPLDSKKVLLPDVRSWIRDIIISLSIAGGVIIFLYQPVKVEGNSMMPE